MSSDDLLKKAIKRFRTLPNQHPGPLTIQFFRAERLILTWTQFQNNKKLFDQLTERASNL